MTGTTRRKKVNGWQAVIHGILIFLAIFVFIFPLWMVVSISLTSEDVIFSRGFQFYPR